MREITKEELQEILANHLLWLKDKEGGVRANLRSTDLSHADLRSANLYGANLYGANLYGANLSGANLRSTDLSHADLRSTDLSHADLYGANLSGANLSHANLRSANLQQLIGEMKYVKSMHLETYYITWTSTHLAIGCQKHEIAKWAKFTDEDIKEMDGDRALKWWKKFKKPVLAMIKLSPAEETGYIAKDS